MPHFIINTSLPSDPCRNFSHLRKTKPCSKALQYRIIYCRSKSLINISPLFIFIYEKYWKFSCTNNFIRNLDPPVAMHLLTCRDRCQLWPGFQQQCREFFFSYQNDERKRLPRCLIFIIPIRRMKDFLILTTVFRLIPKHSEIFIMGLPPWSSNYITCRFQFSWRVNCVMMLISSQPAFKWFYIAA